MTDQEQWRGMVECIGMAFKDTPFHKDLEGLMLRVKKLEQTVYDVSPPPKPTETGTCAIKWDRELREWKTGCRHGVIIRSESPAKFCPFCGKEIV